MTPRFALVMECARVQNSVTVPMVTLVPYVRYLFVLVLLKMKVKCVTNMVLASLMIDVIAKLITTELIVLVTIALEYCTLMSLFAAVTEVVSYQIIVHVNLGILETLANW